MWNREGAATHETEEVREFEGGSPSEERRVVAWIGQSMLFRGTLISSADLTIDGLVQGTVEARDHRLTVGPDADIRAEIVARSITIHGTVIGNVHATAKIEIRSTGRIEGDMVAPSVVVAEGAVVCGRVDSLTGRPDATKRRTKLSIV